MKKFYAIALGALVLMTACSKDDPEPTLPNLVVNETVIQPAYTTLKAPAVSEVTVDDLGNVTAVFENGQKLTMTQQATDRQIVLIIKKIEGAANVIIPAEIALPGVETPRTVGGFYLSSYNPISDQVSTITIPTTAAFNMQGDSTTGMTLRKFNNKFFTDLSEYAANLSAIYFEENFPDYTSDNGAVYRKNGEDFTLAMVPRKNNAKSGVFTVPEGVTEIGDKAFNHCSELTRIIVSQTVTLIGENAFDYNEKLICIDMLGETAPYASESSFGSYARNATLRIPKDSRSSYLLQNPFEELSPNDVHPVPSNYYLTFMNLVDPVNFADTRHYFDDSADWDEATWEQKVPAPVLPADADTQLTQRYTNAINSYNAYMAQMEYFNTDRAKWEIAKKKWNPANAEQIFADAEPIYPAEEVSSPTRPRNPGANATEEEKQEYEAAMAIYNAEYARYTVFTAAVEQYTADFTCWEEAKKLWDATRGYQNFKKVQEVDFQIQ